MAEAGVRYLKARASEMIRAVRERRARYVITYRGRAVAILAPLEGISVEGQAPSPDAGQAAWAELVRLGKKIGKGWKARESGTELLSKMRR